MSHADFINGVGSQNEEDAKEFIEGSIILDEDFSDRKYSHIDFVNSTNGE